MVPAALSIGVGSVEIALNRERSNTQGQQRKQQDATQKKQLTSVGKSRAMAKMERRSRQSVWQERENVSIWPARASRNGVKGIRSYSLNCRHDSVEPRVRQQTSDSKYNRPTHLRDVKELVSSSQRLPTHVYALLGHIDLFFVFLRSLEAIFAQLEHLGSLGFETMVFKVQESGSANFRRQCSVQVPNAVPRLKNAPIATRSEYLLGQFRLVVRIERPVDDDQIDVLRHRNRSRGELRHCPARCSKYWRG